MTRTEKEAEAIDTAEASGLLYVSDADPGLHRHPQGDKFRFTSSNGKTASVQDRRRIDSLVIPPAWKDVWICPSPRGHIQATGRDEKGRKQYLYHSKWREARDQVKYSRMISFGKSLGRLRRRLQSDMRRKGFPKEKVVATVVRLLQTTFIRVGNDEYAKKNKSFGLTTLRDRHVKVSGGTIHFEFKGKSGVRHAIDLQVRNLAKLVKSCQDLPGQELFQYLDESGNRHTVKSEDVNAYLHEATGRDFTAKDFRTWAGTVLAAEALHEFQSFDSAAECKRNVLQAIESVAKRLGNTRTVCRQCYIHPAVLEAYEDADLRDALRLRVESELKRSLAHLRPEEAAVLAFLQERLKKKDDNRVPYTRSSSRSKHRYESRLTISVRYFTSWKRHTGTQGGIWPAWKASSPARLFSLRRACRRTVT